MTLCDRKVVCSVQGETFNFHWIITLLSLVTFGTVVKQHHRILFINFKPGYFSHMKRKRNKNKSGTPSPISKNKVVIIWLRGGKNW